MESTDGFSIPQVVLRHFDLTSTPYTEAFAREVAEKRRTYPDGLLFLDQLLALASVDGPSHYPPTTPAALRRLIYTVRAAPVDRLKQDCFLYYLLLDYDHPAGTPNGYSQHEGDTVMTNGAMASGSELVRSQKGKGKEKEMPSGSSRAEEFARRRCLPRMWRGFIYGYWALDHGLWEEAVEALSDPAITSVNFIPAIFTVLSTHISPPSRSLSLVHTLFVALAPGLDTEAMVALRAISLAFASLSDSFGFIRSRPVTDQARLREQVWCWALGAPRIPCGAGSTGVQPSALTQLLHLPLLPDESVHLTHFLTHPPRSLSSTSLDLLHELVTVRLIHQGQYAECLALDKELAGSGVGREEDRQKRRERVKEFISILPEAQRRVLELDTEVRRGEKEAERRAGGEGINGYTVQEDVDMPSSRLESAVIAASATPRDIVAPIPSRLPAFSVLGGSGPALPSTTAARRIASTASARNVSSPFSGPPQFAFAASPGRGAGPGTPGRGSPALVPRLASGSPFALGVKGSVDVPRPVRRIINDDNDDEDALEKGSVSNRRKVSRPRQASGTSHVVAVSAAPAGSAHSQAEQGQLKTAETSKDLGHADGPVEEDAENEKETREPRVSQDDGDQQDKEGPTRQQDKQDSTDMPPPPVPSRGLRPSRSSHALVKAPPAPRKTPRRATATRNPPSDIPEDAPAPADNRAESQAPPSPAASTHSRSTRRQSTVPPSETGTDVRLTDSMPGAFGLGAPPTPQGRSRITRSASRAVLDEEQPNPGPTPKKARTTTTTTTTQKTHNSKAPSPGPSEAGSVRRSTRRGTREPSVVSSVGDDRPGANGARQRNGGSPTPSAASSSARSVRRGGAREGSITPRVTRTRK